MDSRNNIINYMPNVASHEKRLTKRQNVRADEERERASQRARTLFSAHAIAHQRKKKTRKINRERNTWRSIKQP